MVAQTSRGTQEQSSAFETPALNASLSNRPALGVQTVRVSGIVFFRVQNLYIVSGFKIHRVFLGPEFIGFPGSEFIGAELGL